MSDTGEKGSDTQTPPCSLNLGAVATGEDPTSVAIASIQSAATFPDPNVKYVFRTENGGQVREGPGGCRCYWVGLEGGRCTCHVETWRARRRWGPFGGGGCSPWFGVEVGVV